MANCNWTFHVIETGNPDDEQVRTFINSNLTNGQRLTYKVAQDDRRREDAHAVIIYDENNVRPELYSSKVNVKEFVAKGTNKSDLEAICQEAVDWLNTLSNDRSINARMTLSNSKNPQEILTFYYPYDQG